MKEKKKLCGWAEDYVIAAKALEREVRRQYAKYAHNINRSFERSIIAHG